MSSRRSVLVKADAKEAAEEVMADLTSGAEDLADKVQKYWEESEEKPTLIAVGFGGLLALYFVSNLVNAVDRLPLISNVFELLESSSPDGPRTGISLSRARKRSSPPTSRDSFPRLESTCSVVDRVCRRPLRCGERTFKNELVTEQRLRQKKMRYDERSL
jgi:alpha-beta hydrolase superfamily lysophospholipase